MILFYQTSRFRKSRQNFWHTSHFSELKQKEKIVKQTVIKTLRTIAQGFIRHVSDYPGEEEGVTGELKRLSKEVRGSCLPGERATCNLKLVEHCDINGSTEGGTGLGDYNGPEKQYLQ